MAQPTAHAGFTFSETMTGYVSAGDGDYRAAATAGRRAGEQLRLKLTVTIDDVAAFVRDSTHAARLTGTVAWSRLDREVGVEDGVFQLFVEDQRGRKEMRYRITFRAPDGQFYRLDGFKDVHNDRIVDLWPDTTTLYTTVREKDAVDAPAVARGVLRIGLPALAPQVLSMRAVNARGPADAVGAFARFGRFFAGRLWSEYARLPARHRKQSNRP